MYSNIRLHIFPVFMRNHNATAATTGALIKKHRSRFLTGTVSHRCVKVFNKKTRQKQLTECQKHHSKITGTSAEE